MNKNKFYTKLTSGIFYFSILLFIIAFNFSDNGSGGWTQQFLPSNLPGITDITFTDSLTGYAVTAVGAGNSSYIIKTSNGGDNWDISLTDSTGRNFTKVKFLDNYTGFAGTDYEVGGGRLYKTTNGGEEWNILNNPNQFFSYDDISVLNEQEIWAARDLAFDGGVFRTTNGGVSWQRKYYDVSNGADRIYMVNSRIGFIADGVLSNGFLRKTTNAGDSWILLGDYGFYKMEFIDSLYGYKSDGNLKRTTNGGTSWETILAVQSGNPPHVIRDFALINDSIWGINPEGNILYPNSEIRGVIFKTTNSGINWSYQLPDTSINLRSYRYIDFSDINFGWSYLYNGGVHTTIGGDTVSYPLTSILNSNSNTPKEYQLFQNYPNPFNPKTKIEYEIQKSNSVLIKIFDIQGREIKTLFNNKQSAGKYKIEFDGTGYASGVYYYSLFINENLIESKKMLLIK
jgi:photosystem II stability/assembly factor-like uncharacterized protein